MANTYTLISSSTVGSGGASSIDFTSIPSTFSDLKMVFSTRADSSTNDSKIEFNGITTGYTERAVGGNGSSAYSFADSTTNSLVNPNTFTANTFTNIEFYIPNYTSSTYKSFLIDSVQENNATTSNGIINAALWSNTAAITSIKLSPSTGNFVQYSTAYLYGVKNA